MKPFKRGNRWGGSWGRPGRSRFGYDHRWWGEAPSVDLEGSGYWTSTRKPLPCLLFVLPLLVAYEVGVACLGGPSADALRAGADAWVRHLFALVGLTDRWLLPLVLAIALLAWQAIDRRDWRFPPLTLVGMAIESLILAVGLVGLSRLVDLGFNQLDEPSLLGLPPSRGRPWEELAPLIGFLGAGIYEEAVFRLATIPLLFRLIKVLAIPPLLACTLAITFSSLFFSLAHHAGEPGEAFTLFAFIFRWVAGVFFAYIYMIRGFGVAVGTHCLYDLLVGWLNFHF